MALHPHGLKPKTVKECTNQITTRDSPFGVVYTIHCGCGNFITSAFNSKAAQANWDKHVKERTRTLTTLANARAIVETRI